MIVRCAWCNGTIREDSYETERDSGELGAAGARLVSHGICTRCAVLFESDAEVSRARAIGDLSIALAERRTLAGELRELGAAVRTFGRTIAGTVRSRG
jgi:hypothetical protein